MPYLQFRRREADKIFIMYDNIVLHFKIKYNNKSCHAEYDNIHAYVYIIYHIYLECIVKNILQNILPTSPSLQHFLTHGLSTQTG